MSSTIPSLPLSPKLIPLHDVPSIPTIPHLGTEYMETYRIMYGEKIRANTLIRKGNLHKIKVYLGKLEKLIKGIEELEKEMSKEYEAHLDWDTYDLLEDVRIKACHKVSALRHEYFL